MHTTASATWTANMTVAERGPGSKKKMAHISSTAPPNTRAATRGAPA
ncbi:hypothetical protein [Massilia scottii]|nr:hypothetical protein [Massilia sp. CCM 9029]MDQ1834139.1 hypothetical protein [Massilia sp. CCM 9029]